MRIEDYALIGDLKTAALVSKNGSIDWLCLPRFDSPACFAALLGNEDNGCWQIAPEGEFTSRREYRRDTLILETEFETPEGRVRLTDSMVPGFSSPAVLRVVKGLSGCVKMKMEFVIRFDYGSIIPWVSKNPFGGIKAVAGMNMVRLKTTAGLYGKNLRTYSEFEVLEGKSIPFLMTWTPSWDHEPVEIDSAESSIEECVILWQDWASHCEYEGPYVEQVRRSLITLKSLIFRPTGGIIAAPTTSLPEDIGGVRNWDYRYCWLRDTSLTLMALLSSGYREEAAAWRNWLLRAVAGTPEQVNVLYSITGERRIDESALDWLQGYEGSRPVRVGNAASTQFQLDIYGELLNTFYHGRRGGLEERDATWRIEKKILEFIEQNWRNPDCGIWEVRGPMQQFTHSKVMCWVAFDRAIHSVPESERSKEVERWREVANEIHEDICKNAFDPELNSFVQSYGSKNLDASQLLMPTLGFLPADDPRMLGTVEAIGKSLMHKGFVRRYQTELTADGLKGGEGAFLPCTFWYIDNLILQGRLDEATARFEKVLECANDVGLFAEEFDPDQRRLVGNFPQAFTHVALVNTAYRLEDARVKAAEGKRVRTHSVNQHAGRKPASPSAPARTVSSRH